MKITTFRRGNANLFRALRYAENTVAFGTLHTRVWDTPIPTPTPLQPSLRVWNRGKLAYRHSELVR